MPEVILSPKYQIVIPKKVREEVNLKSGQVIRLVVKEGIISLIPDKPLKEFKGYLKGMRTGNLREEKERL